ncbi:sensor histidine kinase [Acidaminobacter sp. JC074]|uniref:cache domain-containing sensor histidine kinase n=1 Tax=Acidaminobacter sp. JC074 TaxID=2530199 RepID=UPI001F1030BF|nr:sensor histidine kinase [Acidaminobacter sp. JC074]MCH4887695.1 sensor histidine kinase [Acidaminobacter sp. JC074]
MKLSSKIFLYSTIIAVISGSIIMWFSGLSYKNYSIENAQNLANSELTLITNSIDLLVESVNEKTIDIIIDNRTRKTLSDYNNRNIDYATAKSELSDIIIENLGITKKVAGCDVVSIDGTIIDVSPYDDDDVHELINEVIPNDENFSLKWHGPYSVEHYNGLTSSVMVITKNVYDLDSTKLLGRIYLYVDMENFSGIYRDSLEYSDARVFLINNHGKVVLSSDESILEYSIDEIIDIPVETINSSNDKNYEIRDDNVLHYISLKEISFLEWHIVSDIPMHNLQKAYREFFRLTMLLMAIVLITVMITNRILSNSITKNIRSLVQVMKRIDKGERELRAVNSNSYEMSVLNDTFNQFMDTNDRLMEENYQKQEELRELEIMLIQAQIKPHFLYNVLSMISNFVKLDMKEEAISSINSLAAFFRISLSEGNEYITVEREIQLTKNYLIIQKYRYIDVLDYVIEVDENAKAFILPKLLIQPIVENAIYHGIKPKLSKKSFVKICVSVEDQDVVIVIYDNGVGMSPEKLKDVRDRLSSEKNKSFGIYSVHTRIKLCYGEPYGLTIESQENQFTRVTLRISAKELS